MSVRMSKALPRRTVIVAAPVVLQLGFARPVTAQSQPIILKAPVTALGPRMGTTVDFSDATPAEEKMRLIVGRSTFIRTRHRLTRVYLTPAAVLTSFTASPNEVVVTASKPGTSMVVVWDEAGESKTYLIESDINVEGLRATLNQAFVRDEVHVEAVEDRILLTGSVGTVEESDLAVRLATLYAKDVANSLVVNTARVQQVRLKVRFVEVDRSRVEQFGFNFFSAGGNNLAGTTTGQFASTLTASTGGGGTSTAGNKSVSVSDPLNFLLYSSKLNIGMTLQDLASRQVLQILAEPTITTLSGQKADFLAGGEFPFPVVQGSSGGATSITIQFRPFGVKLDFTPMVNPDGTIDLRVSPEVSALDYTNAVTISGYTIPALSTRRVDTHVVLRSGQSFAVSGLLDKRTTDSFSHTPGIASIPILGLLFRSKGINHSNSELIVIVTPTVVDPLTDGDLPQEPSIVIPTLDTGKFDKSLPEKMKK